MMTRLIRPLRFATLLAHASLAIAQAPHPTTHQAMPAAADPIPRTGLGSALPGLSDAHLAEFIDGRLDFLAAETPAGGLGPIFNRDSCAACHAAGAVGGAGDITVTRFGRTENGVFDPLESLGGPLLQERAIDPAAQEVVPKEANTIAQRITTPLFGAGLIEAIPDSAIVLGTLRPKPAGIRGRAAVVSDPASGTQRIGRFGWKAQQATLLAFSGDAYLNEMGITNRLFPTENAPNGKLHLLERFDAVPDIEDAVDPVDGTSDIDRTTAFMRFLAPPPRSAPTPLTAAGERVFAAIDCAACHTPVMQTGRNRIATLDQKPVPLYSDLLLHDMGDLGDGIPQAAAGAREMRTAPLWGLSARPAWLHDGRAKTIDDAIRAHAGEAQDSRDKYVRLRNEERRLLLEFLRSL
jgi:CxxC motif-containing protein (DUF1111 family)